MVASRPILHWRQRIVWLVGRFLHWDRHLLSPSRLPSECPSCMGSPDPCRTWPSLLSQLLSWAHLCRRPSFSYFPASHQTVLVLNNTGSGMSVGHPPSLSPMPWCLRTAGGWLVVVSAVPRPGTSVTASSGPCTLYCSPNLCFDL